MKRYYIGIDIGGTNTKIALLGERFDILKKTSFPTALFKKPHDLLSAITDSVRNMLKTQKVQSAQLYGIGIGVAGLVNARNGIIHNLINIPGWKGINIKKVFKKRFRVPTHVDNDVNIMTLAEFYKGAGRGCNNLVCVALGTGVGGGIVVEGRLYRGSTSSAGEIGHIPINEKGPRCNCGGVACIESYVGNRYLNNKLIRAMKGGKKTILRKMINGDFSKLTLELVSKAAGLGDRFAIDFWKEVGIHIGVALTGIINFLDPDRIVIGGGVAGAGRFLFSPIQKTVGMRTMEVQRRHAKIVKAKLGKDAGLVGAAVLVWLEKNK